MMQTTYLVLNIEEFLAVLWVDNCLKSILMRISLFSDQPFVLEVTVGFRKVYDIDGNMVAVVIRLAFGFFESQRLSTTYLNLTGRFSQGSRAVEDFFIEASDSRGCSCGNVKFDVGDAQLHVAKVPRSMTLDLIAPWTGNGDGVC